MAVDRMMKKISGVNSNKIFEIALNEAKEIAEEDENFRKDRITWFKNN